MNFGVYLLFIIAGLMIIIFVYAIQPVEMNNYKKLVNSYNVKDTSINYQHKIISKAFTPCMPNLESHEISLPKIIDQIAWTKNYCLKFSDFNGIPDKDNPRVVAWTQYLARYYYYIETSNSTKQHFTFQDIRVVAFFNKEKSWVRDLAPYDNLTKQYILRHEQGHFDNAEQFARSAEYIMKMELTQKDFPVIYRTGDLQTDAQSSANFLISSLWNKIAPNLNMTDSIYENNTNYENFYEQIQYDVIFDKLRN